MHAGHVFKLALDVDTVNTAHRAWKSLFHIWGWGTGQNLARDLLIRRPRWRQALRIQIEGFLPMNLFDVKKKVELGGDEEATLGTLHHLV